MQSLLPVLFYLLLLNYSDLMKPRDQNGEHLKGHPQHDFLCLKNCGFICILCIDKVQKGLISEPGLQKIPFSGNWWIKSKSWNNHHAQRIFGLSTEIPNRPDNWWHFQEKKSGTDFRAANHSTWGMGEPRGSWVVWLGTSLNFCWEIYKKKFLQ